MSTDNFKLEQDPDTGSYLACFHSKLVWLFASLHHELLVQVTLRCWQSIYTILHQAPAFPPTSCRSLPLASMSSVEGYSIKFQN